MYFAGSVAKTSFATSIGLEVVLDILISFINPPAIDVAGELGRYVIGTDGSKFVFFKGSLSTKNGNIEPISIAKSVMDYIPLFNDATAVRFDCVHNEAGRRVVRGLLYSTRDYGFFEISGVNGKPEKVVLNNGEFSLAQ